MKIFLVGGAVRDTLLNRPVKDRDYVVVGATPDQMLSLGYEKVGASFPVFLKNGEEYALARTERKTGAGYHGFDVTCDSTVSLEGDLYRRDLTINAMAMDPSSGELIDPYGGQHDLAQGVLRHVSDAFAEDPIRVLRTARFAARYGFSVAADTLLLMRRVATELNTVPKERIWAEIEKGLQEDHPVRMFEVLYRCGALDTPAMRPYNCRFSALADVNQDHGLDIRFTIISSQFNADDYQSYRIPLHLAKVSQMFHRYMYQLFRYYMCLPDVRLNVLTATRALHNHSDIMRCMAILRVISENHPAVNKSIKAIADDIQALSQVDVASISRACDNSRDIAPSIRRARLKVLPFEYC